MSGDGLGLSALVWQRLHKLTASLARATWDGYLGRIRPPGAEIPTYTHRPELAALYELASACPRGSRALEIGSHLGASSVALAAGLARVDGRLWCVDTWANETMPEGPLDTWAEFARNTRRFAGRITAVRKRSDELAEEDVPHELALVFIDGDHSYEATRRDFALAAGRLADGGTIALHDFGVAQFPGVTRAVGEALAGGGWIVTRLVERLVCLQRARWTAPDWLPADGGRT